MSDPADVLNVNTQHGFETHDEADRGTGRCIAERVYLFMGSRDATARADLGSVDPWRSIVAELEIMSVATRTSYWSRCLDLHRHDLEQARRPRRPTHLTAEGFAGEQRRIEELLYEADYEDQVLLKLEKCLAFVVFSFTVNELMRCTRERLRLSLGVVWSVEQEAAFARLDSAAGMEMALIDVVASVSPVSTD